MNEHRIERLEHNLESLERKIEQLMDMVEDLYVPRGARPKYHNVTLLCPPGFGFFGGNTAFEKSREQVGDNVRITLSVFAINGRHAHRIAMESVSAIVLEEE